MKKSLIILCLLLMMVLFSSCRKDDTGNPNTPAPTDFQWTGETTMADADSLLGLEETIEETTVDFAADAEVQTTMSFDYGLPVESGLELEGGLPVETGAAETFAPLATEAPSDIPVEADTSELAQYASEELDTGKENLPYTSDAISPLFIAVGAFLILAILVVTLEKRRAGT